MVNTYKAAVIGLGNIGFQLGLDPRRKTTWSHVAAYEKHFKTKLVGTVEINKDQINTFRKHYKDVPVFDSIKALMHKISVDIVSICTPPKSHYSVLKELVKHPIKIIFCEKPLAATVEEAEELVELCKEKQILLAVNHGRRWNGSYITARKMIENGKIGKIKAVNALYPGQVFNIGTHLFDVIRMLIQKKPLSLSSIASNIDNLDPDISGWIQYDEGIPCTIISTGKREDLIFEVDVIGDEGRIRVLENGEKVEWSSFVGSARYTGYRELSLKDPVIFENKDPLLDAIIDIISVAEGEKPTVNCTGLDGYYALLTSFFMLRSAADKSRSIILGEEECLY